MRTKRPPMVSIIILNFNGREFLRSCLTSVFNSDYPDFEVIFVDDGSTDGSVDFVKERFGGNPRLRIVRNEESLGFAGGNNVGVKHASGSYVVFLNNDTEVDADWLKEMVKVMESDETIGAAQSKLLFAGKRDKIWAVGQSMDYLGDVPAKGRGEKDRGQYDRLEEIFNAVGASMIIRKKVFTEVGMYDPAFFLLHEDVDLGWRIWLGGYRVVSAPKSVVYHVGGATLKKHFIWVNQFVYHAEKNCIAMMTKNYSFKNVVKYVSVRIVVDVREAFELMRVRKKGRAMAIVKAILWNLFNFRYVWNQRLRVQRVLRKVSDEYLMERVMKKPSFPFPLALLNLFPFGLELLERYKPVNRAKAT